MESIQEKAKLADQRIQQLKSLISTVGMSMLIELFQFLMFVGM
jgi:hypothetical protein